MAPRLPCLNPPSRTVLGCGLWLFLATVVGFDAAPAAAQNGMQEESGVSNANYRLAGRFAPYKIRRLIHSTSVSPRWIEDSERYWYEWETSDGKVFTIVDPAAGTKRPIFDTDRIAAE